MVPQYIKKISINNFHFFENLILDFVFNQEISKINFIVGDNASGKTNLLKLIICLEPMFNFVYKNDRFQATLDKNDGIISLKGKKNILSFVKEHDIDPEEAYFNQSLDELSRSKDKVVLSFENSLIDFLPSVNLSANNDLYGIRRSWLKDLLIAGDTVDASLEHTFLRLQDFESSIDFDKHDFINSSSNKVSILDCKLFTEKDLRNYIIGITSPIISIPANRFLFSLDPSVHSSFDWKSVSNSFFNEEIFSPDSIYSTATTMKYFQRIDKLLDMIDKLNNLIQESELFSQIKNIHPSNEKPNKLNFSNGTKDLYFEQLSYGYRSSLTILYNIVFALYTGNQEAYNYSEDKFTNSAVCLVDEIDLHYHPKWQIEFIAFIRKIFPNIQFVFTTHNPAAILNTDNALVHMLRKKNNGKIDVIRYHTTEENLSAYEVMRDVFQIEPGTPINNE